MLHKIALLGAVCAVVSGCSTVTSMYRDSNSQRRIYPVTAHPKNEGTIDLVALLDPLDLGPHRIDVARRKVNSLPGYKPPAGDRNDPDWARLDRALLGFYDNRYPGLLCGPVSANDPDLPAEEQREVCEGKMRPPRNGVTKTSVTDVETVTTRSKKVEQVFFREESVLRRRLISETSLTTKDRKAIPPKQTHLSAFQTARRNIVQDRLLQASNTNCSAFKDDLYLLKSDTSFGFSTAALGLGAAGAIVGDLARTFSALSGATAGTGVAFDKSYFAEQTIPIIIAGIEKRRELARQKIDEKRKSPIEAYSVQAALADAANYHDACSIRSGLDEAKETLSAQLKGLLDNFNKGVADFDAKEEAAAAKADGGQGGAGAGSSSGTSGVGQPPMEALTPQSR